MPSLSPIDGVGLPYFEKYLKPPEKKNVICIPLYDGVHFQGYIVKKSTSIPFAGTIQKNQPLFRLQKYCLKNQIQHLNPFFRRENNLMLTAVV